MELTDELRRVLLGILQRGIVDTRFAILTGDVATAEDLLDALDGIPSHLSDWTTGSWSEVHGNLSSFARRHQEHSTNYESVLNEMTDLLATP